MKTCITILLVFLSLWGYSQSEVDNLSHPFQVLFADEASYIARDEKLKSFDYTRKYGLIRNKGKLVLLHYSGYLFEAGPGLIDIREISEQLNQEGTFTRPEISTAKKGENYGDANSLAVPNSKSYHKIKLSYPWKHTIQLSKHDRLPIHWEYTEEKELPRKFFYEVTVKDLHDKVLLSDQTRDNYYEVILDSLDLPENLIICHISLPSLNEVSDDIVVAFEQDHHEETVGAKHYSQTEYQSFIDGLIAIQKKDYELANHLFFLARDTHEHDYRYDSLYRILLKEYPKLKEDLE